MAGINDLSPLGTKDSPSSPQPVWDVSAYLEGASPQPRPKGSYTETASLPDDAGGSDRSRVAAATADREEPARSQTWLTVSGISYHFDRSRPFNERNFGLGIEHRFDQEHAIVGGVYKNSINNDSLYLAYKWTPLSAGPLRAGLLAGAVNGYRLNNGGPIPMVIPTASLEGQRFGVDLMCVPKMKDISAVCALQMKYRF